MRHPWLVVLALLLATVFAAQARGVVHAWQGDSLLGYRFDRCEGHLAADPLPVAPVAASVGPQHVGEGCDTIHTLRIGWDAWRRAGEAWDTRGSVVSFLLVDFWNLAVEARALNVLDLALFLWPARLLLPPAAALAAVHVGLVALAAVSGVAFARTLGASPLAGLAAGVVAGSSAVVLESVQRGHYPQAVLLGAFVFFGGLVRLTRGERGGVGLAAAGAAFACVLYWQNAVVLGLGAALFLVGARVGGPFAPRTPLRLVAAAAVVIALCLPAAVPVVQALLSGTESKLAVIPWGTPFPVGATDPDQHLDLIDEVPWYALVSPRGGWIPVLPLLPIALFGLTRRDRVGFVALALLGAVLALGPWPVLPGGLGSVVFEGYGTGERGANPLYQLVYQWVPTASRMRHPLRWATLLAVAMTAGTAYGVDRLRARFPDHAVLAVVAGLAWAAFVGPWPLAERPFPRALLDATASCSAIVLPARVNGPVELDDVHRLEGLLWLPRAPEEGNGAHGAGRSSEARAAWSNERMAALAAAVAGDPSGMGDTCVFYEPRWVGPRAAEVRSELLSAFGEPIATIRPTDLFAFNGYTRQVEVFRRR
ncbi:MAG: hypothetical protein V4850_35280 [Myxococcota bacterium]